MASSVFLRLLLVLPQSIAQVTLFEAIVAKLRCTQGTSNPNIFQECILPELFPVSAGFEKQSQKDKAARVDSNREDGQEVSLFESEIWKRNKAIAKNLNHYENIKQVPLSDTAGVYGELVPEGVEQLILSTPGMAISNEDIFFDLGSGVGKVVIQVFLTTVVRQVVGIELDASRHQHAKSALAVMRQLLGDVYHDAALEPPSNDVLEVSGRRIEFVQSDVLQIQMARASLVFVCSLAFPDGLLHALSTQLAAQLLPGSIVFSGRELIGCHRGLKILGHTIAAASWTQAADVYMYMVTPMDNNPPGSAAIYPQDLRLQSKFTDDTKEGFQMHRHRGEQSSTLLCEAREMEGVLSLGATKVNSVLSLIDFNGKTSQGQQLLYHFASKRQTVLDQDRKAFEKHLASSIKTQESFMERRLRKQNQSLDILQILIDRRADPQIENTNRESLWSIAQGSNDSLLVNFLMTRGYSDPVKEDVDSMERREL